MKPIHVRPAVIEDRDLFVKWTIATKNNEADPGILRYRNTSIRVAYNEDGPLVFMPIQRPLHLESLAIKPGASPKQVAKALKVLVQDAILCAFAEGSGELYFMGTEETVPKFATQHKDGEVMKFEELPFRVFRIKIYDKNKAKADSRGNKQPLARANSQNGSRVASKG